MLSLIVSLFCLTRVIKMSMESALMPVPLFLAACLMVLHMLPGRWCV